MSGNKSREDAPNFEEMRRQLQTLRDLFHEYVNNGRQPSQIERPDLPQKDLDTVAMIGLRERMRRTLTAIDDCLGTVDEITQAGGMGPYLRSHMPDDAPAESGKEGL